jgi:hypothetical protein
MILLGADPLSRFLNRAAETPFQWGEHDCLLWLADWIDERRGIDPASELRGKYSTILQAARIVREAGGMERLVDISTRAAGLSRATSGARGDIAIVQVEGDGGAHFGNQAGAILLGGSAVLLCQGGLVMPRLDIAPVIAAWSV